MIDIDKLVNKVGSMVTNATVYFGLRDETPSQLPAINIRPDDDIDITKMTARQSTIEYKFEFFIIVDRKNEQEAYSIMDELMNKINLIDRALGNGTQEFRNRAPVEYTKDHFIIRVPYVYKDINTN